MAKSRTAALTSLRRSILATTLLFMITLTQGVTAQGSWEMRVCAHSDNYPISSRDRPGFENRVAEILASELEAELSYVWTEIDARAVREHLRPGECDLMMGVGEGAGDLLNTVAYYRAPYVFVSRQDSDFGVDSLDDEVLKQLSITTYPNSVLHTALSRYGLADNLVLPSLSRLTDATERVAAVLQPVIEGDVDVAVVYGPEAAGFAEQHPEELNIVPVSPEIVPPLLPMFRTVTIGVRPGDEALRDRLNIALASRWEEILSVFEEYGVPVLPLSKPAVPPPPQAELVRIGAVLPIPTGNRAMTDTLGEAARVGALVAENLVVSVGADASSPTLDVLLASAPSEEAAVRAAERLAVTENVVGFLGGFGEGVARSLSEVAEERAVLFFNIGSIESELRQEECGRNTFHVEASARMYLDGLAGWFASEGGERWFIVHEASEQGTTLYEQAVRALEEVGAEVVGEFGAQPGPRAYNEQFDQIREAEADVLLLLQDPEDQEFFLSQLAFAELDMSVTGFPHPVMQTRAFITRLRQVTSPAGRHWAMLWETTLEANGADELNQSFMSRSGEPMDSSAWAAYAAVKILYQAVLVSGTQEPASLVEYLESSDATFDIHKGSGVSFRDWNHQLEQPLYLVRIDPEAEWGLEVSKRAALAELVGELPELYLPDLEPAERLERLGEGREESSCRF
jgi:ABC transporter substrate binding protein (PQQ-dependent alcohol dehydrogenase system)